MKSISFHLTISILLGITGYLSLHLIQTSQQLRKIKSQMICSTRKIEATSKKMLDLWRVNIEEQPQFFHQVT